MVAGGRVIEKVSSSVFFSSLGVPAGFVLVNSPLVGSVRLVLLTSASVTIISCVVVVMVLRFICVIWHVFDLLFIHDLCSSVYRCIEVEDLQRSVHVQKWVTKPGSSLNHLSTKEYNLTNQRRIHPVKVPGNSNRLWLFISAVEKICGGYS